MVDLSDWEPSRDYKQVVIPEDVDKTEYHCYTRRADIYRRIRDKGFGGLPTYQDLADEYGLKSPNSIAQDIDELRKYIIKEMDSQHVRSTVADSLRWALEEAKKDGDKAEVRKISKELNKWAQSVGVEEKEPEKHEIEHKGTMLADKIRQAYEEKDDE